MSHRIHSQARTTPKVRAEIRASTLSQAELARLYNVSRHTIRKWQGRVEQDDLSHCPHTLKTTLTPVQEVIVAELRRTLLLPLDDLLQVTRTFINPDVSRSGLNRCLRRLGIANLRALQPEEEGRNRPVKTFKDYEPGFIHVDIKYLPRMPDETERRYLFVAIDRASRWVYLRIYKNQSEASSVDFLRRLEHAAPIKISNKVSTGQHAFDRACTEYDVEHRLIPPRHPQTNGMVERFNGRISEVLQQTRFASAAELEATLMQYCKVYNYAIPQRALNHKTPIESLKQWQQNRPALFTKRVYNLTGLDI